MLGSKRHAHQGRSRSHRQKAGAGRWLRRLHTRVPGSHWMRCPSSDFDIAEHRRARFVARGADGVHPGGRSAPCPRYCPRRRPAGWPWSRRRLCRCRCTARPAPRASRFRPAWRWCWPPARDRPTVTSGGTSPVRVATTGIRSVAPCEPHSLLCTVWVCTPRSVPSGSGVNDHTTVSDCVAIGPPRGFLALHLHLCGARPASARRRNAECRYCRCRRSSAFDGWRRPAWSRWQRTRPRCTRRKRPTSW